MPQPKSRGRKRSKSPKKDSNPSPTKPVVRVSNKGTTSKLKKHTPSKYVNPGHSPTNPLPESTRKDSKKKKPRSRTTSPRRHRGTSGKHQASPSISPSRSRSTSLSSEDSSSSSKSTSSSSSSSLNSLERRRIRKYLKDNVLKETPRHSKHSRKSKHSKRVKEHKESSRQSRLRSSSKTPITKYTRRSRSKGRASQSPKKQKPLQDLQNPSGGQSSGSHQSPSLPQISADDQAVMQGLLEDLYKSNVPSSMMRQCQQSIFDRFYRTPGTQGKTSSQLPFSMSVPQVVTYLSTPSSSVTSMQTSQTRKRSVPRQIKKPAIVFNLPASTSQPLNQASTFSNPANIKSTSKGADLKQKPRSKSPILNKSSTSSNEPSRKKPSFSTSEGSVLRLGKNVKQSIAPNGCIIGSIFAGNRRIPKQLDFKGEFSHLMEPVKPISYSVVYAGYSHAIGLSNDPSRNEAPLFMNFGSRNATQLERFMIGQHITVFKYRYVLGKTEILKSKNVADWINPDTNEVTPVTSAYAYTKEPCKNGTHFAVALTTDSKSEVRNSRTLLTCKVATRRVKNVTVSNDKISPAFTGRITIGNTVSIDYFMPMKNSHYLAYGMVLTKTQLPEIPTEDCTPVTANQPYIICVETPTKLTEESLSNLANPWHTYSNIGEYSKDFRTIADIAAAMTGLELYINLQRIEQVVLTGDIQAFEKYHLTQINVDTSKQDPVKHQGTLAYIKKGEILDIYYRDEKVTQDFTICQAVVRSVTSENGYITRLLVQRVIYRIRKPLEPNDPLVDINYENEDGVLEPTRDQLTPVTAKDSDAQWWSDTGYPQEGIKLAPAYNANGLDYRFRAQTYSWKSPNPSEETRNNYIDTVLSGIQPGNLWQQVQTTASATQLVLPHPVLTEDEIKARPDIGKLNDDQ